MTEKTTREEKDREAVPPILSPLPVVIIPADLIFNITDCKLYVPVVTLQEKQENKLLENLKTGISFDFEWGRYRT